MDPAGLFGNSVGMLTVPWLTARETAALIVVAVSLLFFRVFRERCLLAWGAGWIAYGTFLWVARAGELHAGSKSMAAFAQADFVLAMAIVCGSGAAVCARAASPDGVARGLLGADDLRRHAASVFSGFQEHRAGVGCGMPPDCGRRSHRIAALPVRADWPGAFPIRRRTADVESALASLYQSHSE